ncbi:hypothetical protein [Mycolicibacterium sphagni]|uniref:hypothetical protein n=1 Tax=Mycolicibacterium sphagni TaxID=1786 RepID=UPI0031F506D1
MFDSGLSIVCDVLETANNLREDLQLPPPRWEITLAGFRRHHRTARGHQLRAEPPASVDADVLVVPAVGAKNPAQLIGVIEESIGVIEDRRSGARPNS